MAKSLKDRIRNLLKRGKVEYQRNNANNKYNRTEAKEEVKPIVDPFKNAPAVKEGFWKKLSS
jgi:hypothetical protein